MRRKNLSSRVHRNVLTRACIDALDRRILFAGAAMSTTMPGTLLIDGTAGNDAISVRYRGPRLDVRINGVLQTFVARDVLRIEIQAYAGHDVVDWSSIAIPTYINAGEGNDSVYGGSGNDTLTGAAGKDLLYGNGGNDRINGAAHNDIIYGGDGDDVLYGGDANDYMDGGTGRDRLFGEEGDDSLIGGIHNDGLYGGGGRDKLLGQRGNDILSGDGGNDQLWGGDDNDILYGGLGSDVLYGENGDDTLYARGDNAIDHVDGGPGIDSGEADLNDVLVNAEAVSVPSGNVTVSDVPSVSFNDEALLDANFATAVNYARSLGVKAVRLWLDVDNYTDRPNAWDNVTVEQVAWKWQGNSTNRAVTAGLVMKRAFELKNEGFAVLITVNRSGGAAPDSDKQVQDFYRHLINATYTPNSTLKFKDVVDYWEIGNEIDLTYYWNPAGATNWEDRLDKYVTLLFKPVAEVLHDPANGVEEQVILGSICWAAYNLNKLLARVQAHGVMHHVDYVGFHTYAPFSTNPAEDSLAENIINAKNYAAAFGKKLISTEWNLRNFALDGSQDAAWASEIDRVYRELILPNFELAFYYGLVNNFDARGGNVSARPAGLLVHNTNIKVTPGSNLATLVDYYQTPLVPAAEFFDMFNGLPKTGN